MVSRGLCTGLKLPTEVEESAAAAAAAAAASLGPDGDDRAMEMRGDDDFVLLVVMGPPTLGVSAFVPSTRV